VFMQTACSRSSLRVTGVSRIIKRTLSQANWSDRMTFTLSTYLDRQWHSILGWN